MADNHTGLNAQYDRPFFPGIDSGAGSFQAPGSAGISAGDTAGGVVGTPVVSNPYGSSQLPENRPTLDVTGGDTSGFSDDTPAHESVIEPGPVAEYLSTGAGAGNSSHFPRHSWQQPDGSA